MTQRLFSTPKRLHLSSFSLYLFIYSAVLECSSAAEEKTGKENVMAPGGGPPKKVVPESQLGGNLLTGGGRGTERARRPQPPQGRRPQLVQEPQFRHQPGLTGGGLKRQPSLRSILHGCPNRSSHSTQVRQAWDLPSGILGGARVRKGVTKLTHGRLRREACTADSRPEVDFGPASGLGKGIPGGSHYRKYYRSDGEEVMEHSSVLPCAISKLEPSAVHEP